MQLNRRDAKHMRAADQTYRGELMCQETPLRAKRVIGSTACHLQPDRLVRRLLTLAFRGAPVLLAVLLLSHPAPAAEAMRESFGTLADGRSVDAVTLSNSAGIRVRIIALGATIQSLVTPDRNGHGGDIVLGFDSAQEYQRSRGYFGATLGRFANRIAKARFTLEGHEYTLEPNDRANSLHGGDHGFDQVLWDIDSVTSGKQAGAVFSIVSADGAGGYPGTLKVTAAYSLDEHNTLRLELRATTDKPTVINLSNHSYFNLSADGASAMNHLLEIHATRYTPVDEQLIPTGEMLEVAGSPFDFRSATAVGLRIRDARNGQIRFGHGYDHNFVLDGPAGTLRPAVRLIDPASGRILTLYTTAPGIQFYSGNFFNGAIAGKGARLYRQGDGLAFEPQQFPDAPNQPSFPSARLDPGAVYENLIEYRFSVDKTPFHTR
jgi:aldose 1-epimerase